MKFFSQFITMVLLSTPVLSSPYALVLHGGAGAIPKEHMTPKLEKQYRAQLGQILGTASEILIHGGSSDAAVLKAVELLENSALFNAGRGSVLNASAQVEMDAGFANSQGQIGGVMGVQNVKNPIFLAQKIAQKSQHHYFTGAGAEAQARAMGLEFEDSAYFTVGFRQKQLKKAKDSKGYYLDHTDLPMQLADTDKHGTVGAVALDKNGNISAATSTGGLVNKQAGRVGDSPIFGSGTFAHKDTCGISATGKGEVIIQNMVSAQIHFSMKSGASLSQAIDLVLRQLPDASAGIIAVDKMGSIVTAYNTKGMYRAMVSSTEQPQIKIWNY